MGHLPLWLSGPNIFVGKNLTTMCCAIELWIGYTGVVLNAKQQQQW